MTEPQWQLRVSHKHGTDAPRATVAVDLTRTPRGAMSARVVMPDGRRLGCLALYQRVDPIHRLCLRLLEAGWMVWHVAPPGEAVPDDGRPEMHGAHADRRALAEQTAALDWLAGRVQSVPVTLAREALVGGCAVRVSYTRGSWHYLSVTGSPSPDLAKRLKAAGYTRGRDRGYAIFYWTDAPPDAPKRRPPPPAPQPGAAPPTAPPAGVVEAPPGARRLTVVDGAGAGAGKAKRGSLRVVPAAPP